jgi:hypothetical protein
MTCVREGNVYWWVCFLVSGLRNFLNQFWIARNSVCSFCGAMAWSLSVTSTAESSSDCAVVDSAEVGRSAVIAGIITALGHCLREHQHWLETVQCTRFQPLRVSACYANMIFVQGSNSEVETVLIFTEVQCAIICWMFDVQKFCRNYFLFSRALFILCTFRCVCFFVECFCLKPTWWLCINLLFKYSGEHPSD